MRFSERMGIRPVRSTLQVANIDDALRNKLWNVVSVRLRSSAFGPGTDYLSNDGGMETLFVELWHYYFKWPTDTLGGSYRRAVRQVRDHFWGSEWHTIFDLIEFLAQSLNAYGSSRDYHTYGYATRADFIAACNFTLEEEMSAYRFVSGRIVQITSEHEVGAIEQAIDLKDPLRPVALHLAQALSLLADRKAPDYRNSIKESISAVEALCKLVSGLPKATLGPALSSVEKSATLHPSLKEAFHKLYAFTSDAEGIRHALMDEPTLDLEDAKFMLVSCSAFVNYMVLKAKKAGIKV